MGVELGAAQFRIGSCSIPNWEDLNSELGGLHFRIGERIGVELGSDVGVDLGRDAG